MVLLVVGSPPVRSCVRCGPFKHSRGCELRREWSGVEWRGGDLNSVWIRRLAGFRGLVLRVVILAVD